MNVLNNELVVAVDVDQTLILHDYENHPLLPLKVINCPYKKEPLTVAIHKAHVDLVKDYKARGFFVIVWSHAGFNWANTVVKHLMLADYVDLIMTKPSKHVDDTPADRILGVNVYLPPSTTGKA
jgi:hypothetical protein